MFPGEDDGSEQPRSSDPGLSLHLRMMMSEEFQLQNKLLRGDIQLIITTFQQEMKLVQKMVKEEMQKFFLPGTRNDVPEERSLHLKFLDGVSAPVLTSKEFKGIRDGPLKVALFDATGNPITSGPESSAEVEIVLIDAIGNDTTNEDFERRIIRAGDKEKPHFAKNEYVKLVKGEAVLINQKLGQDKDWTRTWTCRLGARFVKDFRGLKVKNAWTERFEVKDNRGELYRNHERPLLTSEVWRLKGICRNGKPCRSLKAKNIKIVQDFLFWHSVNPKELQKILGAGENRWNIVVDHARTCIIDDKKMYYHKSSTEPPMAIIYDYVGELKGLIIDEFNFVPINNLSADKKDHAYKLLNLLLEPDAFDKRHQTYFNDEASLMRQHPFKSSTSCTIQQCSNPIDPGCSSQLISRPPILDPENIDGGINPSSTNDSAYTRPTVEQQQSLASGFHQDHALHQQHRPYKSSGDTTSIQQFAPSSSSQLITRPILNPENINGGINPSNTNDSVNIRPMVEQQQSLASGFHQDHALHQQHRPYKSSGDTTSIQQFAPSSSSQLITRPILNPENINGGINPSNTNDSVNIRPMVEKQQSLASGFHQDHALHQQHRPYKSSGDTTSIQQFAPSSSSQLITRPILNPENINGGINPSNTSDSVNIRPMVEQQQSLASGFHQDHALHQQHRPYKSSGDTTFIQQFAPSSSSQLITRPILNPENINGGINPSNTNDSVNIRPMVEQQQSLASGFHQDHALHQQHRPYKSSGDTTSIQQFAPSSSSQLITRPILNPENINGGINPSNTNDSVNIRPMVEQQQSLASGFHQDHAPQQQYRPYKSSGYSTSIQQFAPSSSSQLISRPTLDPENIDGGSGRVIGSSQRLPPLDGGINPSNTNDYADIRPMVEQQQSLASGFHLDHALQQYRPYKSSWYNASIQQFAPSSSSHLISRPILDPENIDGGIILSNTNNEKVKACNNENSLQLPLPCLGDSLFGGNAYGSLVIDDFIMDYLKQSTKKIEKTDQQMPGCSMDLNVVDAQVISEIESNAIKKRKVQASPVQQNPYKSSTNCTIQQCSNPIDPSCSSQLISPPIIDPENIDGNIPSNTNDSVDIRYMVIEQQQSLASGFHQDHALQPYKSSVDNASIQQFAPSCSSQFISHNNNASGMELDQEEALMEDFRASLNEIGWNSMWDNGHNPNAHLLDPVSGSEYVGDIFMAALHDDDDVQPDV